MSAFRVGVDVGGTFTDIVLLDRDGTLHTKKISSSVDDYARSIVDGLATVVREQSLAIGALSSVLHGTTVASNAILERRGALTGLITTRGFRDVLEIRNLRIPRLYDITWRKPAPLVERRLRLEIDERINAAGVVQRPIDRDEVRHCVHQLLRAGVEAIAVTLLNAYANPAHERAVADVVAQEARGLLCCISSDVLPEMREYERTSTTVINTYVKPVVGRYLERLGDGLTALGVRGPLWLMQSSGGLIGAPIAAELPMHIIESGPAGGVIGAQAMARKLGLGDIISFDMGGTTAKASLIENDQVTRAQEYQVGGGILTGSRLLTGDGYLLKVPAIDLAEVGAGGGSIVQVDAGGAMKVGPRSAGAMPGPACYALGGEEPTVTDANLILGYINPRHLCGGEVALDPALALRAFETRVAKPLGLSLERAAFGAHQIAVANMMRAVRAVSVERGRDPRRFALFAFGGNGPLFAASMARELGIASVVVPPAAGLFSSFGFLYADVESHFSRTLRAAIGGTDAAVVEAAFADIEAKAVTRLDVGRRAALSIQRQATLRYRGQSLELPVTLEPGVIDMAALDRLAKTFEREHERTFGHKAQAGEPVELVNLRVVVRDPGERSSVPHRLRPSRALPPLGEAERDCYFGPQFGWIKAPVLRRDGLDNRRAGPLVIEEYDATCVVPPGASAWQDESGNIRMDVGRQ